ncbi:hypothetical protein N7495_004289 [Penicillium taxi]|uniref:uncharacterized protein n=1 Tax=Penicillium taxi TaxID=168475 RepID=UPI0025458004|nr:uncharacterized protein N7495_004289 [Penicillium taxi]KAJ5899545.1 hypothetical protein N7495_004289 [Penicillium taxi]
MEECDLIASSDLGTHIDAPFLPYWARSSALAQDLLEYSDEPIEYDHDDQDYSDNCFFFPEDCSWTPPKDQTVKVVPELIFPAPIESAPDSMIPGLPDIKMLDSEALSDLLEDNLSPPEITSIFIYPLFNHAQSLIPKLLSSVFATNGAVFAYASSLSTRQLRNLSATYGAAYTCYAKTASTGNLTGVNPASHPSSYVTAQSMSLGDVGSIVFELEDSVAVVTRIGDKLLLAAVGPGKPEAAASGIDPDYLGIEGISADANGATSDATAGDGRVSVAAPVSNTLSNGNLDTQVEIDRSADLARLASLNLSAPPSVLLALESKCAALGRFLGAKLDDLESPEDF